LYFFNDYPIQNPDELINSGVLLIIVILGILFVISSWSGKLSFKGFLLVVVAGIILILLNSEGHIPSGGPNPCPGHEVILVINGECRGMDMDKNVEILKRFLGDDNE
jgi:hypothetical protein